MNGAGRSGGLFARLLVTAAALALGACHRELGEPPSDAAPAGGAVLDARGALLDERVAPPFDAASPMGALLAGRAALLDALVAQKAFVTGRLIAHVSHVCNLEIDGELFPVVDVQELVKGAVVPRGVNIVRVLDSNLRLVRSFEYMSARPLFCGGNRLYVYGDLRVDLVPGEGNVLVFGAGAELSKIERMESNDLPAPSDRRSLQ